MENSSHEGCPTTNHHGNRIVRNDIWGKFQNIWKSKLLHIAPLLSHLIFFLIPYSLIEIARYRSSHLSQTPPPLVSRCRNDSGQAGWLLQFLSEAEWQHWAHSFILCCVTANSHILQLSEPCLRCWRVSSQCVCSWLLYPASGRIWLPWCCCCFHVIHLI